LEYHKNDKNIPQLTYEQEEASDRTLWFLRIPLTSESCASILKEFMSKIVLKRPFYL